jgi:1-acyl-sn-glycerol-3-phosphate acyltransferase
VNNLRFACRILLIVAGLLACLPLHYAWKLVRRPSPWPQRFLYWVGRSAGLRARSVGTPLQRNVLFVSNHLSWLDIMILAGATGTAFVSRDDVGRWPVIGWLADMNNTIYVDRSNKRAVHGQADTLRTALTSGQPVALFPEGTTDGGTNVLPFRASLLSALFPPIPSLKVQPVAVDYGDAGSDIAWTGEEGAGANARRVLSRKAKVPVTLHFLEPLDPVQLGDRKALAQASRDAIVAALGPSARASDHL